MKYPKLFLASNARKLLMMLGLTYIFTVVLLVFNLYASQHYFYEQNQPYRSLLDSTRDVMWNAECEIMTFLAIVMSVIAGSMMFGTLSDRRSRLNTLEIPASQREKFLTWFTVYLPLTIVGLWICFYLGQITRVCWTHLFTPYGSYAHIIPFHRVILLEGNFVLETQDIYDTFPTYSALIFINSFFALGSIFFPKLTFLKTAISGAILSSLLGLAALLGYMAFFGLRASTESRFLILDEFPQRTFIISGCLLLCALGCYLLSYYRFRQTEIIDRW